MLFLLLLLLLLAVGSLHVGRYGGLCLFTKHMPCMGGTWSGKGYDCGLTAAEQCLLRPEMG